MATALQHVNADQLVELAEHLRATGSALQVLDVREPWELAVAHLDHPLLPVRAMPMQSVPARLGELDPDQPLAVLCHHGVRSLQVGHFLQSQGVQTVFNITGGIDAWARDVDPGVPLY